MEKDLKVFYMFNGLIMIAERINNDLNALQVKSALALAPGQQQGVYLVTVTTISGSVSRKMLVTQQ